MLRAEKRTAVISHYYKQEVRRGLGNFKTLIIELGLDTLVSEVIRINLLFLSSDRHHISSGASGPSSRPSTPPLTSTSSGKQLSLGALISLAFYFHKKKY